MAKKYLTVMNSRVRFRKRELFPGVVHLEFNRRQDLTATLLRFQEYYESPRFRQAIFTVEEFVSWYRKKKGSFSYFTDWSGINFPGSVLQVFRQGKMNPLTTREQQILRRIPQDKKVYVIGTFRTAKNSTDLNVLKHEIAHALFYLDANYRRQVRRILQQINWSSMRRYIQKLGYHESVFEDECHAYLCSVDESLEESVNLRPYRQVIQQLEANFTKYLAKHQA